jgi:hypothetical protein
LEVELLNSMIKELKYTDEERRREYFYKLLSLARVGLVGETAQPKLAMLSLNKLKEEIMIREASKIKNKHMIRLGIPALAMGSISAVIGLHVIHFSNVLKFGLYFFVWTGAMAGAWLSFGVRKISLSFEELSIIEKDLVSPTLRLIFVGVASLFLTLFLKSGIVSLTVGSLNTNSIDSNIEFQFLLGSIAGLLESKLAIDLSNQVLNIFKKT